MRTLRNPVANFTVETVVAFIGAVLVLPLLLKLIFGTIKSLFRLGFVRRLLVDSMVVGATALLTRSDVLDKLFGPRNDGAQHRTEGARPPVSVRR